MRLQLPRGWYHLPGTPTSAHYTQWLLGGDNCPCSEGRRPHSWCMGWEMGGHFGKGLAQLWGEGFCFCLA